MNTKQLKRYNLVIYGILLAILVVEQTSIADALTWPHRIIATFIMLFLSGANITWLLSTIFKKQLEPWAFITISIANSIFIIPVIIQGIYAYTQSMTIQTILLVYIIAGALPWTWDILALLIPKKIHHYTVSKISWDINKKTLLHPLVLVGTLVLIVHIVNITQYNFIPAPDTYSWLTEIERNLPNNSIKSLYPSHRQAFSVLIAIFHILGKFELYTLYKYRFALLPLLTLPPLWLMAKKLKTKSSQIMLMTSIFISSTVVIEFEYVRQQIIFLWFLYIALGLLAYAKYKKDTLPYYLVGAYIFLGTFYHPLFSILVVTWTLSLAIKHINYLWKYKYIVLLFTVLSYPTLKILRIEKIATLIYKQTTYGISNIIHFNWNLAFPTSYTNVDGFTMGWTGISGIIKYYGFYAGPIAIALIIIIAILCIKKTNIRKNLLHPEYITITALFLFFFVVSEIAPRFMNIAYLPDRSWQYIGITSTLFIYIILSHLPPKTRWKKYIVLFWTLGIVINIIGAGYINHLTRYTMPEYELRAAAWLKENTQKNSIVFATSSKHLLQYHAKQNYMRIDQNTPANTDTSVLLKDIASRFDTLKNNTAALLHLARMSNNQVRVQSEELERQLEKNKEKEITIKKVKNYVSQVSRLEAEIMITRKQADKAYSLLKKTSKNTNETPPVYIYYAKIHPNNPYATRPYKKNMTTKTRKPYNALHNNSEIFTKVYEDGDNVIIWYLDPEITKKYR